MVASIRRSIAVVVSIALLAPTPAFAQPRKKPIRDSLTPDAKAQWDRALDLYNHSNWDGARTSFFAAYEASHNPRILFNVAVCEKNMNRYGRAIEMFKRELVEGAGNLPADEEAAAKQQIAGLEQFVAHLTIDVSEPGADVFVDETKVGTSPLKEPVIVQLGERHVRATKAGFGEGAETVDLKGGSAGHVALKLTPAQRTSLVQITVVGPPAADVTVDGKLVGQAPYKGQVLVSPEPHQIGAQAPGWVPATQPAVVREGEALTLTIQLAREQEKGKLVIVTKPEGAAIEIDGKTVGASRWEGPVDARSHQIVVKKQGFYSWSYDVDVPKGGERSVTASLNEDRNTSFVPWLIGTVVIVGTSAFVAYEIARPKDQERVNGSLQPYTLGTPARRW